MTPESLEFIPRRVRDALDAIAAKISLSDWQALTLDERERLVALAGAEGTTSAGDARAAFAEYLRDRIVARTGSPPRTLEPGRGPGS